MLVDESRQAKQGIFNIRSFRIFRYLRLIIQADIVHIHSGHYLFRLLHFLAAKVFFKRVVITIHSYSVAAKGNFERLLDRLVARYSYKVLFVNKEIAEMFKLKKFHVQNAFLPPVDEQEALPTEISSWLDRKQNAHWTICAANASKLVKYKGEDLYGLDLCLDVASRLKSNGILCAIIFVISDPSGDFSLDLYRSRILNEQLEDFIFLYDRPISFVSLIKRSEIILRPTNTDGDSLTLREALFMGKPVIASDVVRRPEGAILFRSRDAKALGDAIFTVMQFRSHQNVNCDQRARFQEFVDFYHTLYN